MTGCDKLFCVLEPELDLGDVTVETDSTDIAPPWSSVDISKARRETGSTSRVVVDRQVQKKDKKHLGFKGEAVLDDRLTKSREALGQEARKKDRNGKGE